MHAGQIADNTLRQSKNILIVTATLATRCAIEGGLDIESAYQLSDIYIQEGEKLQNASISVSDVAAYVGKSRSYLSRCFKSELGFQMNEFIMRCKLEEAKSLLTYTDKSISEISHNSLSKHLHPTLCCPHSIHSLHFKIR